MKKPITIYASEVLAKKIANLRIREQELVKEISIAQKQGDLSENFEYHAAKKARGKVSDEIDQIASIIASTVPMKLPESPTVVSFGALVQLSSSESGVTEYLILNDCEAEPSKGSIGISSLMFRSMAGKEEGDEFILKTPDFERKYKIVSIRGVTKEEYNLRVSEQMV